MSGNDIPTIGIITAGKARLVEGFVAGLSELGFLEGQNVRYEQRHANGDLTKLSVLVGDLIERRVDLFAVIGAITVRAVCQAGIRVPVVYAVVVDPVIDSLAANLETPNGHLTGVTTFDPDQARTHVELFRSVVPKIKRIAILGNAGVSGFLINQNLKAVERFGLRSQVITIAGPQPDLEKAFESLDQARSEALIVLEHPVNAAHCESIAELALVRRLPTVFPREQVDAGGLFCYGTSLRTAAHRMARYASKILAGANPGDLPIEAVRSRELVVNLQTAQKLGLTVNPKILSGATHVVQSGAALPESSASSPPVQCLLAARSRPQPPHLRRPLEDMGDSVSLCSGPQATLE